MRGTNATTGKTLDGAAWIRQAVTDILTTPIGSRVGRRDYGSRLFALTDSPLNPSGLLDLYAATIEAIDKWLLDANGNKLLKINSVKASTVTPGKVTITLDASILATGERTMIGGIVL
jgi:hypothetical protein